MLNLPENCNTFSQPIDDQLLQEHHARLEHELLVLFLAYLLYVKLSLHTHVPYPFFVPDELHQMHLYQLL